MTCPLAQDSQSTNRRYIRKTSSQAHPMCSREGETRMYAYIRVKSLRLFPNPPRKMRFFQSQRKKKQKKTNKQKPTKEKQLPSKEKQKNTAKVCTIHLSVWWLRTEKFVIMKTSKLWRLPSGGLRTRMGMLERIGKIKRKTEDAKQKP